MEVSCTTGRESLAGQELQASYKADFPAVQIPGWLCGMELDYQNRGWDKHYHVDVVASLPRGGGIT
ncbi:hypothetical protein [Oscillibacter ruminantium]|uniref:hypothetical protein n=1 Tax=Oscillibacter ruminantium TaxID=1263547 RepID=UPI0033205688